MSDQEGNSAEREAEARALVDRLRTLTLATTSRAGVPEASYAPFVHDADAFHVYVSALARHTAHLVERPHAGVLLIEDESATRQPFARTRLSLQCTVAPLDRDTDAGQALLARFEERFGEVMALIRPLPDFRLLRLVPEHGTFVRGFGQAYTFTGPAIGGFVHVDEQRVRGRDR